LHLDRLFAALDLSEACLDTQHRGLCRIALTVRRRTCEQRLNFAQLFAEDRVLHRALPADTVENPAAPAIGYDADDPADAEPEAPRQAVSRPGDLWLLGAHRLLFGDSTDAAGVARVMESDSAAMLFTSPSL
jgi:hypothetical protein